MSTQKKSLAVFGYIRQNYQHHMPEVLVRLCLLFFDQDVTLIIRGNKLKQLLSSKKNCGVGIYRIKFNQDLCIVIYIISNRAGPRCRCIDNFHVALSVDTMLVDIDHVIICSEIRCYDPATENEPLVPNMKASLKFTQENERQAKCAPIAKSSQFENAQQLIIKFIIHSLKIKYKTLTNTNTSYYPSSTAAQLNGITLLKLNVPELLMNKFKNWHNGITFHGPLSNNLCIWCRPNGTTPECVGMFKYGVAFISFPETITKMRVKCVVKCNLNEVVNEYKRVIRDKQRYIYFEKNTFLTNKLEDQLTFDIKVVIMELYDLNNDIIPRDKWNHHDVISNH